VRLDSEEVECVGLPRVALEDLPAERVGLGEPTGMVVFSGGLKKLGERGHPDLFLVLGISGRGERRVYEKRSGGLTAVLRELLGPQSP